MAVAEQLYTTELGEQSIDVSASKRKFQTSIILKQDKNKSGILSFLEKVRQEQDLPNNESAQLAAQTMTPSQGYD